MKKFYGLRGLLLPMETLKRYRIQRMSGTIGELKQNSSSCVDNIQASSAKSLKNMETRLGLYLEKTEDISNA